MTNAHQTLSDTQSGHVAHAGTTPEPARNPTVDEHRRAHHRRPCARTPSDACISRLPHPNH